LKPAVRNAAVHPEGEGFIRVPAPGPVGYYDFKSYFSPFLDATLLSENTLHTGLGGKRSDYSGVSHQQYFSSGTWTAKAHHRLCVAKDVVLHGVVRCGEIYSNPTVRDILPGFGYEVRPAGADASNQNGPVERARLTVANAMRAMLLGANLDFKFWPNSRKGIFLGFLPNTTKNILWYDVETSEVKIAKHARFDEGLNDLPFGEIPPNVQHLRAYNRVNPFPLNLMIHPSMNSRLLSTPLLTP
jgi:hypothetical protein